MNDVVITFKCSSEDAARALAKAIEEATTLIADVRESVNQSGTFFVDVIVGQE